MHYSKKKVAIGRVTIFTMCGTLSYFEEILAIARPKVAADLTGFPRSPARSPLRNTQFTRVEACTRDVGLHRPSAITASNRLVGGSQRYFQEHNRLGNLLNVHRAMRKICRY